MNAKAVNYGEQFEQWIASGKGLYIRWCNGERLTVRQLSAISNWNKRQLWAELDKDSSDTSELRRLEDVQKLVDYEIEQRH